MRWPVQRKCERRFVHFDPNKRPESIEELIIALEELQVKHPYTYPEAKAWWKRFDVQA